MNRMEKKYNNLDEAKAFVLSFDNMVYTYDDLCFLEYESSPCEQCGKSVQIKDYLAPKANFKKPYGILDSLDMVVSKELKDELINRFDITEKDFRPVLSKKGDVVCYQVAPEHVMIPINRENNWALLKSCSKCGAVEYSSYEFTNEKGEDYYYISQSALDDMRDLNITYERFGCNMPMFIISRRVYEYLIKEYPNTHYFPLFLKKDN